MTHKRFEVVVEVVPPAGADVEPLLSALEGINDLSFTGFSVATNPVAKPRMDALSLCRILQDELKRPATLHVTTRDHNRLSLQGILWGAKALGITTVLAMTGDFVPLAEKGMTSSVRDISLTELIGMARQAGLNVGVVMNPFTDELRLGIAVKRLKEKVAAGAQFVVTQPVYTAKDAEILAGALNPLGIPVMLGILPLRTFRHAAFLHHKVSGIEVPDEVRSAMATAENPTAEGIRQARDLLTAARTCFDGVCIMPPFDHFEILHGVLPREGGDAG
ncbi:methylenetetrahydrofolate reductase [Desulfoluna butyratoxydans]|uniref:Methylenetetrahydrofolate reductase n=1 Tax=Desulfoluna butyratoxydans TaxID=231438 RepID=A0A4U8YQA0_9BACT|nr:methylenetetrahydrofolate reductase [Desulfoluna butyratoxydans]VFQ43902.1 methylenetetrahydrofolate reductase [Desulfoluna butyratoxydans]